MLLFHQSRSWIVGRQCIFASKFLSDKNKAVFFSCSMSFVYSHPYSMAGHVETNVPTNREKSRIVPGWCKENLEIIFIILSLLSAGTSSVMLIELKNDPKNVHVWVGSKILFLQLIIKPKALKKRHAFFQVFLALSVIGAQA